MNLKKLFKENEVALLREDLEKRAKKFPPEGIDIVKSGKSKFRIKDMEQNEMLYPAMYYGKDFIRGPDVFDPKTQYHDKGLELNFLLDELKRCIIKKDSLVLPAKFADTIANNAVYLFDPLHPKYNRIVREDPLSKKKYAIVGANISIGYAILEDLETGKHYKLKFRYNSYNDVIEFRWYHGFFADSVVCEPIEVEKRSIEIVEPV